MKSVQIIIKISLSNLSNPMCIIHLHLNLYAKFSLRILDLCPNFIQFTIEKVDSHAQLVPSILKSFPTTF